MTVVRRFADHEGMSDHEPDSTQDFDARYRLIGEAAMRRAERRVIGADYGATSYPTVAQADTLAELLGLAPGHLLLDVGSGAGWPGVYLARSTGCDVVLTDLPLDGLRAASLRLRSEGVSGTLVAASGDALPFRASAFDAVTSSDALC